MDDLAPVRSGIPQGSVLGPTLFVVFINDLPLEVTSTVRIFTDDTKIFRKISSSVDSAALQADLTHLVSWSNIWQMKFNASKCKSMHLGSSNSRHVYTMDDHSLEQVRQERDLGVIVDEKLNRQPPQ